MKNILTTPIRDEDIENLTAGDIVYTLDGEEPTDIADLDKQQLKQFRRHLSMVFQDPYSSLNP